MLYPSPSVQPRACNSHLCKSATVRELEHLDPAIAPRGALLVEQDPTLTSWVYPMLWPAKCTRSVLNIQPFSGRVADILY